MNKQAKIIIGTLTGVIIILLIVIASLLSKTNKPKEAEETISNKKDIEKVVGIYHTNSWNNREATLQLENNLSCKYPSSKDTCTYEIKGDNITITLTSYTIKAETELSFYSTYTNKESCEADIERLQGTYNLKDATCEAKSNKHEAVLTNNGVLLHDTLFSKIK